MDEVSLGVTTELFLLIMIVLLCVAILLFIVNLVLGIVEDHIRYTRTWEIFVEWCTKKWNQLKSILKRINN